MGISLSSFRGFYLGLKLAQTTVLKRLSTLAEMLSMAPGSIREKLLSIPAVTGVDAPGG